MIGPSEFFEKVSVDIGGTLPTTARGNKNFVIIKNYATGPMFWYPCKFKSEMLKVVTDFRTWIELQFKSKPRRITSGDELRSNSFAGWFKETRISGSLHFPILQRTGHVHCHGSCSVGHEGCEAS